MLRYCFSLQGSRCDFSEQLCLRTTELYDDLLLLLVCFPFYISYLVLLFHLVYVFQVLQLFILFSQAFIRCSRKTFVYTYIQNSRKYICTQHRSTSICKANTNNHKGKNWQQHNNSGELKHPTFVNGPIIQTEN